MVFIYKKILLAVDESENSNRAIEKLIDLQRSWNCKVVMFHSIKHPTKPLLAGSFLAGSGGSYNISESELLQEVHKTGEKILLAKQELFNKEQLPVETRLIIEDHPENYIKKSVEEESFDLVVIGTKGIHSKLKQILLGSVANKVVKHAPCDVLIIR